MPKIRSIQNMLLTALAPIVWGSTYIITTEVLPPNTPLLTSTIRALPAGILLLLICRTLPKGIWWLRIMILSALNIGAFFYFLFVAAEYLPGGTASLIVACQPIMVILLSTCILKTSLTIKHIISAALGVIGISLLVLNSTTSLNWQGVIAGFAGCSCMALGVVLTKYWNRSTNLSLLSFTGWQLTLGGLMLLPVAMSIEGLPQHLTVTNMLGYSYLCMVGTVFSYIIWFRGIEKLPVVTISFLGFLSSLSACILGYLFLKQTFSLPQMLGVCTIIIAVWLSIPRESDKKIR
ncbi:EamA family transporter [Xenorhabdus griffiniae]|uniref:EamA family transporter n=1 Tax=Xenorhabdus griffiniae TaxID=351672 RepID=A0ABY9XCL0_9GAMM|nr:EamA family transporter [Xenorhabdus griffiniae]MBD1226424.1 EamA family transporter [Xenorhabdus griffiniae]MBE8588031.1 EamA family transporter [Xenorhabdus griffiniae]WMV70650.1 EamA family transporter [Xenorhabdus griffiniae]WNH00327.1 EamA family transporter [Xenorhabdus griffiniae]